MITSGSYGLASKRLFENAGTVREPSHISGLGYLLVVTVEAVEPDGTVVESTITKQPKERHCPFAPVGSGWTFLGHDDANNTSVYRRRRRHTVYYGTAEAERQMRRRQEARRQAGGGGKT